MTVPVLALASAAFAPEPVSARDARRFLHSFLDGRGLVEDLLDAAELALSEVVTNAVLHAHTPFEVSLSLDADGALRVEVVDHNAQMPAQRDYAEQATTGRGMELVAAYTRECGVESRGADGKVVWFVVAADPETEEPDRRDLLHGWDIDQIEPRSRDEAPASEVVTLLSLPPTLWLAAREHHDAVLRELALYGAEHPGAVPPPERVALADRARSWVSTRLVAALDRLAASTSAAKAHRALPDGHPSPLPDTPAAYDLDLSLPPSAAAAFAALQDVLDTAEQLAAGGQLLARPALPEIVAVRDWACEQVISQQSGVRPSPWPGTGQDRFTRLVNNRHEPALPDWDARTVSESDRGAVAADDANRIIAVSRPLAASLGWAVEDLVGRRVVVLIPPELREAHVAGFTRHLTTGEAHALGVPLRLPVLRADGNRLQCDFLIEQTPAPTGRTVYIAWIEPDRQP